MKVVTRQMVERLQGAIEDVSHDHKVTRVRMDEVQPMAQEAHAMVSAHTRLLSRGFWGRMKWLFKGE